MGELEVVGECHRLEARDVTVGLEIHQGIRVARDERSSNEFRNDIGWDRQSGHGLDKADGKQSDEGDDYTEYHDHGRSTRRINADTDHSDRRKDHKDNQVNPLRYIFVVLPHQTAVNILSQSIDIILGC